MEKHSYASPRIIREVKHEVASPLLAGSVVTPNTKIRSAGQDLDSHSFDDTGFNNTWE